PRILGTSINTTFGGAIQNFTNDVLGTFSSTTLGIDIEYEDQQDGRKKYCQIKSGPNTINKDDVETIHQHFKAVKNLSRTNNLALQLNDMVVGIVYGERSEISQHYKNLESKHDYIVLVGREFWEKLTGDNEFYDDLIAVIDEVAEESDFSEELDSIIKDLSNDKKIIELSNMANKESK
uniref:PmeII family type II restriction endonuclease n=1 Tax=Acinetobacter sp. 10FS3-1 TaxID=2563897 RepID=UPI0015D4034C